MLRGLLGELLTAVARSIAEREDHVADGGIVELTNGVGQLQSPLADCAGTFEREVAFVLDRPVKQSRVVLAVAGDNRLNGPVAILETAVVPGRAGVRVGAVQEISV